MKNVRYNKDSVIKHYSSFWGKEYNVLTWDVERAKELGEDFCILEFPPRDSKNMWTYATCCMSNDDDNPIELHIYSKDKDESLIALLTIIAHFHRFDEKLGLSHTVNFGVPWKPRSNCSYGLISLPYLDGIEFELLNIGKNRIVHFYWLVPITKEEVTFKKENGIDSLEDIFEKDELNYIDPLRNSVI